MAKSVAFPLYMALGVDSKITKLKTPSIIEDV